MNPVELYFYTYFLIFLGWYVMKNSIKSWRLGIIAFRVENYILSLIHFFFVFVGPFAYVSIILCILVLLGMFAVVGGGIII